MNSWTLSRSICAVPAASVSVGGTGAVSHVVSRASSLADWDDDVLSEDVV